MKFKILNTFYLIIGISAILMGVVAIPDKQTPSFVTLIMGTYFVIDAIGNFIFTSNKNR